MENVLFTFTKKDPSEFLVEQRVKSNEQRVKSNEQRAKSNEQRAKNNEQRAKRNEQKVTSNKQKVTNNEQRAKSFTSTSQHLLQKLHFQLLYMHYIDFTVITTI